jgi:predicted RNase H-like nuclease (RuvC/YqgF family)
LDYKKTKAKPERFKRLGITVGKKVGHIMTTDTTYIELLKMAHESLDSKDAKIAELDKECIDAKNHMVDLSKTVTEYGNHIAELEKELKAYKCLDGDLIYITKKELLQRELEQYVKGVNDFANKFCGDCKTLEQADVSFRAESFIKALKEQE